MIHGYDLGKSTGFAILGPNGFVDSGVWSFAHHTDHGRMFLQFHRHIDGSWSNLRPSLVVYEEPCTRMSKAWAAIFYGLRAVLLLNCQNRQIPWVPVHTSEWKQFAGLSGNAKKPAVMTLALDLWPTIPIRQDEVDARFIALSGLHAHEGGVR